MNIGWAVSEMWRGARVRRAGWNGKGMWLKIVQPGDYIYTRGHEPDISVMRNLQTFVGMKAADGSFVPWSCSQTDLLAADWELA